MPSRFNTLAAQVLFGGTEVIEFDCDDGDESDGYFSCSDSADGVAESDPTGDYLPRVRQAIGALSSEFTSVSSMVSGIGCGLSGFSARLDAIDPSELESIISVLEAALLATDSSAACEGPPITGRTRRKVKRAARARAMEEAASALIH